MKIILDRQRKTVAKFSNNLPGVDWAYSSLKQHTNEYSRRVAANIKRARAALNLESIEEYFNNLEDVVRDMPAATLFNYDETNISDDPGKKIGITAEAANILKRQSTFPKAGIPLQFYIIYKSLHLDNTWKE